MMLHEAPLRSSLTVVAVTDVARRTLHAHGIWPGARVEVSQVAAWGGRLVRVGADRLALDDRACRSIEVDAA